MTDIAALLRAARIIPVLTIHDAALAIPLAEALVAGGLTALEITLRTPAARAAVTAIRHHVPLAQAGLGTVTTTEDLALAADLNLPFCFSPGATPVLLAEAARRNLNLVPGVATASELMVAMSEGYHVVKFFPAVPAGGIATLRAFAAPFAEARFCPTGGITPETAPAFLAEANVLAVGGSWLAPPADQAAHDWGVITARANACLAGLNPV